MLTSAKMAKGGRDSATALSEHARTLINPEFRGLLEAKQIRTSTPPAQAPAPAGTAYTAGPAPLAGVLALVEVGAASTAAALRSALRALGASVRSTWVPAVTHVVWGAGGSAAVRRTALRLNALVVSPRWVWRCAAESRRVSEDEHSIPRPSDPPSPRRMRSLLRWAEKENIPLDSSGDEDAEAGPRLRLSVTGDSGGDGPPIRVRPRRRLYTPRPHSASHSSDSGTDAESALKALPSSGSARRRISAAHPVIVCSGVVTAVRDEARAATATLGGLVEKRVSAHTTHVVCGGERTLATLEGAARGCWAVDTRWLRDSSAAGRWLPPQHYALRATCRAHVVARALRAAGGAGGPLLDVFAGMQVCVLRGARHATGAARLLRLCGATLTRAEDAALVVTDSEAEATARSTGDAVSSRWVFDSVGAGRPRSLSGYRPRTSVAVNS